MGTRGISEQNAVSRGRSPRVRAFCSDIPCSNHGITILYPKSNSHRISLFLILMKMVTIMVKIVTKLDCKVYILVLM